ncbi:MAG TPA: DUF3015 domain-containing protein [Thiothrix sp.]|nr:DUF3015 domain-containing protein [Thiothrix sp.]
MKLTTKTLTIIGTSLTALAMMGNAQAERAFGDIYMECGIGAMIFPTNTTMAAISNVTWDLGTTAVSSNASSQDSCKGKKVAAAAFIHSSYASLEQDIAKGEGKHLSALMDIMQCDGASRTNMVNKVRTDFTTTATAKGYANSTQYQKSEKLFNIMNSSKVAGSCGA